MDLHHGYKLIRRCTVNGFQVKVADAVDHRIRHTEHIRCGVEGRGGTVATGRVGFHRAAPVSGPGRQSAGIPADQGKVPSLFKEAGGPCGADASGGTEYHGMGVGGRHTCQNRVKNFSLLIVKIHRLQPLNLTLLIRIALARAPPA